MLYWLLFQVLQRYISPFRVFGYITTRVALASLSALFLSLWLGPWMIRKLREHEFRAAYPGRRAQIASEKGGDADYGRRADCDVDR